MKKVSVRSITGALNLFSEIYHAKPLYSPVEPSFPLALYGAGNLGKMAWEYCQNLGLPVSYVIDSQAHHHQQDHFWKKVCLKAPNQISLEERRTTQLLVCIANLPYTPLAYDLFQQGWLSVFPFYDVAEFLKTQHPLSNGWFWTEQNSSEFEAIECVLKRWDDDVSRAHHLQFMAWRRLREDWVFDDAPVVINNRYFIPEILPDSQERFLDLGAHHGEVFSRFLDWNSNSFDIYWAVEPDQENLKVLRQNLTKTPHDNVKVIPVALAERPQNEYRFYQGLGYASQHCLYSPDFLPATTVDELKLSPSFIKVHLEGEELSVLKGALSTLTQFRPVLAITSYHNHFGLWKLPLWLDQHLEDYCLLMRLHSWCGTGAVVYAIPNERVQS